MNIPENMRAFDINLAQQGHPLCTRDGRPAKFIAYVPENDELYRVIVTINGQTFSMSVGGAYSDGDWSNHDLFLAPLGMCEGKPVFAGDVLIGSAGEFIVEIGMASLGLCKWPSKVPVVQTRMDYEDLCEYYEDIAKKEYAANSSELKHFTWSSKACKNLANKAIERSIADGDCVPTAHVVDLMCKAYDINYQTNDFSFRQNAEFVLKQYLGGLK